MNGSKPIDSHRSCGCLFGEHLPPPTSVTHRACAQQQLIPCRVLGDLRTIQERPQRYTRQTATSLHSLSKQFQFNPLSARLNPICYLLALLGAHHILHVSRVRVNQPFIDDPRFRWSSIITLSRCIGRMICGWPRSSWISEKHSSCMTLRRCLVPLSSQLI